MKRLWKKIKTALLDWRIESPCCKPGKLHINTFEDAYEHLKDCAELSLESKSNFLVAKEIKKISKEIKCKKK